jgi:imidazolonepropionase-like amidohydrolase
MPRCLILLVALAVTASPAPAQRSEAIAIVGTTIIDGTGRPPLRDATIVLEGEVISAVGPAARIRVPAGARVIDGRGKFVIPGFVDVNVHLTPYNFAAAGIANWSDSAAIAGAIRGARQLLGHGITTSRDSYGILPLLIAARDSMQRDSLPQPRILIAGNVIGWGDVYSYTFSGSTGGRPRDSVTRRVSAALVQGVGENVIDLTADSLRKVVTRYLRSGPDFLKIGVTAHTDDPAPLLFAPRALAAMIEVAHAMGKRVDVHAGTFEALRAAALADVDVLQHPEVLAHRLTDADAREIARTGAICGLVAHLITGPGWSEFRTHVAAGGRMWPAEMPLERLRARNDSLRRAGVAPNTAPAPSIIAYETVRENAERLIRQGCRVAVATDDVAGPHREMGVATLSAIEGLVELGMTPMQALAAGTANGAAATGDASVGTLSAGKRADLVMLARDPLDDIRNIRKIELVVAAGRLVPR